MTLSYSLACELRDAGFPQGNGHNETKTRTDPFNNYGDMAAYFPTLEELIEACMQDWRGIEAIIHEHSQGGDDTWVATSFHDGRINGQGKTPLEAVTRLWLALHPKKEI